MLTAGKTTSAQVNHVWSSNILQLMSISLFSAAPDGSCVSRCGVYVEDGGPVLILAGTGLDVEDDDHNRLFFMQVQILLI